MLCGRFSLQDLANIASEILNKTLRFLYQRVGTICSQYFHSRISSDINYGKYPVCKLTFEKLLIYDFYFYVERWLEMMRDYYWLIVSPRHGVTNLRRSQMMVRWAEVQTRPDQTSSTTLSSSSDLWPPTQSAGTEQRFLRGAHSHPPTLRSART